MAITSQDIAAETTSDAPVPMSHTARQTCIRQNAYRKMLRAFSLITTIGGNLILAFGCSVGYTTARQPV